MKASEIDAYNARFTYTIADQTWERRIEHLTREWQIVSIALLVMGVLCGFVLGRL